MKFDDVVGAKYVKESKWIRVENNSGTIHGHPITQEEYLRLLK